MSQARQRWRLVFSRGEDARFLSHLDAVKAWERAFRRGSIPIATTEGLHPRPRLIFAAPLQLGMLAERELADLYLSERLTLPDFRDRLFRALPPGYGVVDLHDVWLGAPALAPQLVAADYRATLVGLTAAELRRAAEALLAAERLDREKRREGKSIGYDLRPLLVALRIGELEAEEAAAVASEMPGGANRGDPPGAHLWARLRHSQDGGSGRLEEVVAALAEEAGAAPPAPPSAPSAPSAPSDEADTLDSGALEIVEPVRERLWLAEELGDAQDGTVTPPLPRSGVADSV